MRAFDQIYQNIQDAKYENKKWAWADYHDEIQMRRENISGWEMLRQVYSEEDNRLNELFKQDLKIAFGLQNYPKFENMWRKAYEDGHSGGYYGILVEFEELMEVIVWNE